MTGETKEKTKQLTDPDFGRIAARYDRIQPNMRPITDALLERLPEMDDGALVLDVGSGTGEPGLTLARHYPSLRVLGIDKEPAMVGVARHKAATGPVPNARFGVMDAEKLDLATDSVAAVVSQNGLLLFGDPVATSAEAARVLAAGGPFSLAVWDRPQLNTFTVLALRTLGGVLPPGEVPGVEWMDGLAAPGRREGWLRDAGMASVRSELFRWSARLPGFPAVRDLMEIGPFGSLFSNLDPETSARAYGHLEDLVSEYREPEGTTGCRWRVACSGVGLDPPCVEREGRTPPWCFRSAAREHDATRTKGGTLSIERFVWRGREVALIDLSDTLENSTSAFEPNAHDITYVDHASGKEIASGLFESALGIPKEATDSKVFPRGHAWAVEEATLSTHSGTHVDAPYHYGPKTRDGGRPRAIDEVPLRWCFGDGVLLDMTHKGREEGISRADVEAGLHRIGYELKPFDIVLIRTGASERFKQPGYDRTHPGLRRDATAYLVGRGVRTIGIDAWGLDRAFDVMAGEVLRGETSAEFWEAHLFGLEEEYAQIEKLSNLDALPVSHGFLVMAFPYKIRGASAGWSRVVALVEEDARGAGGDPT